MSKKKWLDFLSVNAITAAGALTTYVFRLDLLSSVFLFLLIPSLYLCFRAKKNIKKIIFASFVLGVLGGMAYDFIAEFNKAYWVRYRPDWLNAHIIGATPLGDFIWAFIIPFSIFVFYEHFVDDERDRRISPRSKKALLLSLVAFLIPVVYLALYPHSPFLFYGYLLMGLLSMLPAFFLISFHPPLIRKIFLASFYFIFVNSLFEIVSLSLGNWGFSGNYIGWIIVLGLRMPIEEVVFWIVPSAAIFLICYEVFFDDKK